ncbi:putative glycosyltransferase EpsH [Abditibacteriota bacterium]|nr:putative glycosyltransferase EpsH [Abditibacteriota bacterium]
MPLPRVDIVIAGRNEERHLGECLDSLRQQDYPAELVSIFVVDNGSTDRTPEIARERGVRVLTQSEPGASAARNLGISSGQGELVAFFDAHCIANRGWVRAMAAPFVDASVGGCQAHIESRSDDARVQRYLDQTGVLDNAHIVDDTVSGKKNLYPWLLAGNSMYRRQALLEAGGFNEKLRACEDVELAWRVVLLGYQFYYVNGASVIHYDGNLWRGFLKKGFYYAQGAADLAWMYQEHGAKSKFAPAPWWTGSWERSLAGLWYRLGYTRKNMRLRLGLDRPSRRSPITVRPEFRQWFPWDESTEVQISSDAIYWFRQNESIIVHIPSKQRMVLDSVSDLIWRRLASQNTKLEVANVLVERYAIAQATALADIDDFVEELIASRVLNRRARQ